jgi:hypothetical protein
MVQSKPEVSSNAEQLPVDQNRRIQNVRPPNIREGTEAISGLVDKTEKRKVIF